MIVCTLLLIQTPLVELFLVSLVPEIVQLDHRNMQQLHNGSLINFTNFKLSTFKNATFLGADIGMHLKTAALDLVLAESDDSVCSRSCVCV